MSDETSAVKSQIPLYGAIFVFLVGILLTLIAYRVIQGNEIELITTRFESGAGMRARTLDSNFRAAMFGRGVLGRGNGEQRVNPSGNQRIAQDGIGTSNPNSDNQRRRRNGAAGRGNGNGVAFDRALNDFIQRMPDSEDKDVITGAWIPRIAYPDVANHEAAIREHHSPDYQLRPAIANESTDGEAAKRYAYPLLLGTNDKENLVLEGMDLAEVPAFREAVDSVIKTAARFFTTRPFDWQVDEMQKHAIAAIRPIYNTENLSRTALTTEAESTSEERNEYLRGFYAIVIDATTLIQGTFYDPKDQNGSGGVDVYIRHLGFNEESSIVAIYNSEKNKVIFDGIADYVASKSPTSILPIDNPLPKPLEHRVCRDAQLRRFPVNQPATYLSVARHTSLRHSRGLYTHGDRSQPRGQPANRPAYA
jgi:hypothetical protein